MKRFILMALFCMFILAAGMVDGASAEVKVVTEGSGDEYPHYLDMKTLPEIKDDIIMIPLQDLADEMAWQVSWNENASALYIDGNGRVMQIAVGCTRAMIDSSAVDLPSSPYISGGNVMIPLSFTAESMGYYVEYSQAWNDLEQVYITPYQLVSDNELYRINEKNFSPSYDPDGFLTFRLKEDGKTPGGIGIASSIRDVLQVYGVPKSPYRTLNYYHDWTGKLVYWGTFVPNSGLGTFFEFTFEQGLLVDLTISC